MTTLELAQFVTANLQPSQTAQFAEALKTEIDNLPNLSDKIMIFDQLASVGITVEGVKCQRHPA